MEERLDLLIALNREILESLVEISSKLDCLSSIELSIDSVERSTSEISDIRFATDSIKEELQWHEDLSAASKILKAIEEVAQAIESR